jgi:hypothetical protein
MIAEPDGPAGRLYLTTAAHRAKVLLSDRDAAMSDGLPFQTGKFLIIAGMFVDGSVLILMLTPIFLPIATKENLRKVLEYEVSKYTPFEKEEIYFDYQILKEEKEWLDLFAVFIKREEVDCASRFAEEGRDSTHFHPDSFHLCPQPFLLS